MPIGPETNPELFEDFESCVSGVLESDDWDVGTEEEAKKLCGSWQQRIEGNNIVVYRANQVDPTRTKTRRASFQRAFRGRLRTIRGDNRRFIQDFERPIRKGRAVERYRRFITTITEDELVESVPRRLVRRGSHWTGGHVQESYRKGLDLAERFLNRSGYDERVVSRAVSSSTDAHRETRELLLIRAFNETEDLGSELVSASTRVFEEGVESGRGFYPIADDANARIRGDVVNSANSSANTVVVSSVNQAALTAYREAGVENVGVQIESQSTSGLSNNHIRVNAAGEVFWETAMDDRVCAECASLEGRVMKISELTGSPHLQPPIHPNCRCILVPMPMEAESGGEVVDPTGVFA